MGYIGMCGPKGWGLIAIFVRNRVRVLESGQHTPTQFFECKAAPLRDVGDPVMMGDARRIFGVWLQNALLTRHLVGFPSWFYLTGYMQSKVQSDLFHFSIFIKTKLPWVVSTKRSWEYTHYHLKTVQRDWLIPATRLHPLRVQFQLFEKLASAN